MVIKALAVWWCIVLPCFMASACILINTLLTRGN